MILPAMALFGLLSPNGLFLYWLFYEYEGFSSLLKTGLHLHSSWMHFWQWGCWHMPLPEDQSAESNGIGLLCFRSSVDLDLVSHFIGG
jgi:hypothetical protein